MNTTVAFAAQATAILMGFFTRVIFTRMLSEGYVGINGLFNDILNILSLSELGVGTAITYALYGPIAKKDIKKQQILMRMFRTFYRATAGVVLLVGLALLPFLDVLMKERPDVDHLTRKYLHVGNGGPAVSLSEGRMQGKAARGGAEGYPEKCEGHVYAQARKCGG